MADVGFVPLDGGYGWIIIASCTLINSCVTPLLQCFAIIFESTFQKLNVKAAEISFLLHLHNSVMCTLGFLSAPLLKKYSFRQLTLVACFLICSGIFLTSFFHTYVSLIVTICILIGIGQGILMPSTALAINSYFKKRLTLAMSYSVTGVGLLPIFMPAICNQLLNHYGSMGTVLILSGLSLHAFVGALLLRPIKVRKKEKAFIADDVKENQENKKFVSDEEDSDKLPDYDKSTHQTPSKTSNVSKVHKKFEKLWNLFDLELFKNRTFVFIIIGMGISYVAELNFILMTPFVLYEMANFARADVALAMSIQAAFDITGRLVIPILAHRSGWSPKLMYAVSLIGSSLGRTTLAIFCDRRNVVLACSVLWGLSKGAKAVFQSLILPKYIPYEKLATSMGVLMILNGSLSLIIGPFIGWIHDIKQTYKYPLHVASLLSLSCIFIWVLEYYLCGKIEQASQTIETNQDNEENV